MELPQLPFCQDPPDSGSIPPSKGHQISEHTNQQSPLQERNGLEDQESLKAWIDAQVDERAKCKATESREAPSNFHQVTVFTVLHDHEASRMSRHVALASSWAIVLVQSIAIAAFMVSLTTPSCSTDTNNPVECPAGFYCHSPKIQRGTPAQLRVASPEYCVECESIPNNAYYQRCSDDTKVEVELEKLCNAYFLNASAIADSKYSRQYWDCDPRVPQELEAACNSCKGARDFRSIRDLTMDRIELTRLPDWFMILVCLFYSCGYVRHTIPAPASRIVLATSHPQS